MTGSVGEHAVRPAAVLGHPQRGIDVAGGGEGAVGQVVDVPPPVHPRVGAVGEERPVGDLVPVHVRTGRVAVEVARDQGEPSGPGEGGEPVGLGQPDGGRVVAQVDGGQAQGALGQCPVGPGKADLDVGRGVPVGRRRVPVLPGQDERAAVADEQGVAVGRAGPGLGHVPGHPQPLLHVVLLAGLEFLPEHHVRAPLRDPVACGLGVDAVFDVPADAGDRLGVHGVLRSVGLGSGHSNPQADRDSTMPSNRKWA